MPDVVVVGQIARDLVLRVRGSPGSPTTNVLARREMLGGKGTNQAVALAQLGVPVALVDIVGDNAQRRHLEHVPDDVLATERDVFAASKLIDSANAVIGQLQQPVDTLLLAARHARAASARSSSTALPTRRSLTCPSCSPTPTSSERTPPRPSA